MNLCCKCDHYVWSRGCRADELIEIPNYITGRPTYRKPKNALWVRDEPIGDIENVRGDSPNCEKWTPKRPWWRFRGSDRRARI